ncbi:MAG: GNAT family N-acetyltransferase [Pikeienuella sp.]|uniref:GNAT family N-acetyltransferase n=1 Tax=Pikeienuella sp. TaxID=2831957 RepID=UPI00391B2192
MTMAFAEPATVTIPSLTTARLRLRAPGPSDFEAYAEFSASPRAAGVGGPISRTEAFGKFCALVGHWRMRGYGRWVIADLERDVPLGVVGPMYPEGWPEPEIAWTVFEAAEGKGVAFEAAQAARAFAYGTLGWRTAISCTLPGNTRSEALARRMGAVEESLFAHPEGFELKVWRHPAPEAVQ